MARYQINNLSEEQLEYIKNALELYTRITIGQLDLIAYLFFKRLDLDTYLEFRDDLDKLSKKYINENKYNLFHDKPSNVMWEMYQITRYFLSWKNYPEGGLTVNFDEPLILTDKPLIVIKEIEDDSDN